MILLVLSLITLEVGALKEAGYTWWLPPNTGATNIDGFNGRGAGERTITTGAFIKFLETVRFWAIEISGSSGRSYRLSCDDDSLFFGNIDRRSGLSIRPVKNSTSLNHGEIGSYIGNNGRTYATICINGLEWLSENLAETQFQTGEDIPEVIGDSAWLNLTTAGMCAFENDWSNV